MSRVRGLAIPALLLLLWELAPRLGLVDAGLLPPPSRVLGAGLVLMRSGALLAHLAASLWRVGLGYALAVTFALPLGLALGLNPALDSYLNPLLQALRPIAPPAWVPLAILWLGIGDPPAVFVIFVGTVLAEAILERFGRIPMCWTCSMDELNTVDGIGNKRARALWKLLQ